MTNAIRAEWIKLTTIRSPYWCLGLAAVLGIGITGIFSAVFSNLSEITGDGSGTHVDGQALQVLLVGLHQFAMIVLMIMAILGITSEYRFSTIRASFLATPKRGVVLGAKAVAYTAPTFVTMLVLTVICLVIIAAGLGGVHFGDADVIRNIWGIPLVAALGVLFSIGVGALVRQTAGAISLVLVWMLVLESILSAVPKVSDWAGPFLPFLNGSHFLSGSAGSTDFHWGPYGSLIYFMIWAVVMFGAGVLVMNRRDA